MDRSKPVIHNDQGRFFCRGVRGFKTGLNPVKNEPDGEFPNGLTVYDPVLFECPIIIDFDGDLIAF